MCGGGGHFFILGPAADVCSTASRAAMPGLSRSSDEGIECLVPVVTGHVGLRFPAPDANISGCRHMIWLYRCLHHPGVHHRKASMFSCLNYL